MTSALLKTTIKKQINEVQNETILRSIHALLKEALKDNDNTSLLTKAQKSELDKTLAEHKAGKIKYYTLIQAKQLLSKASK
jgi:Na+-translocating ferredoxin:NAD+ oxidoreductase RnfG subunit